jgi:CubicO group peptidase (beta-lactamase class C family)
MNKTKYLILLSLILLSGHIVVSQGLTSKQIDSIVQVSMDSMPHAGLAVAVVKDGNLIHSKGYGVISINNNEKVDNHTRFAIASNSKAFTSAALAILVDEGKINWNDKVVDHIPEFTTYDPYVTASFTIIDLLTHRSGLDLGAGDLMWIPDGNDFNFNDVVKSFQYQTPVSDFRTTYDYDNLMYMVAGEIISRQSGMSWSEFIESRIMDPLGMYESAGIRQRLKDKSNVAKPHSLIDGELVEIDEFDSEMAAAAAGIYASVDDLSSWMLMHLNHGVVNDTPLISRRNHSNMWRPYINRGFTTQPRQPYNTHFNAYGLGWGIRDVKGYIKLNHTGGLPGMISQTILIPELDLGVVVLTNADPGGYSFISIPNAIIDSYIGIDSVDWVSRMSNAIKTREAEGDSVTNMVWKTVKKAKNKHLDFEDYIGTFNDNWFGNMVIEEKDNELWISAERSPKLTGKMYYYKANTFAIRWDYRDMECDAFASFTLNKDGKAASFTMEGISPNIDFSFDFQHLNLKRVE